jgi:hypothetical protein
MSSSKEEQESLPAIDYQSHLNFKNLKPIQDKLSDCPRLLVLKQSIDQEYTYYTITEVTYWDYTYCLHETRLPVVRSLHSNRTIWRVSFYKEVRVLNDFGWYSNTSFLTAITRDCFSPRLLFHVVNFQSIITA